MEMTINRHSNSSSCVSTVHAMKTHIYKEGGYIDSNLPPYLKWEGQIRQ